MVVGSTSQFSRRTLPVLFALWQLGCAGVEVPQARVHREDDVTAALRAQATAELRCPLEQLELEASGPRRYNVRGCAVSATFCCFKRSLEVFCENAATAPVPPVFVGDEPYRPRGGAGCYDPWLEAPPAIERFQPVSAVDYGILTH